MIELEKGLEIAAPQEIQDEALPRFEAQIRTWDVALPEVPPLVLDFGLGDFYQTGLIEFWIANEMEASRLRGEAQRRWRLSQLEKPVRESTRSECAAIDQAIARVDSQLRELHSASQGDRWTAERRALTIGASPSAVEW